MKQDTQSGTKESSSTETQTESTNITTIDGKTQSSYITDTETKSISEIINTGSTSTTENGTKGTKGGTTMKLLEGMRIRIIDMKGEPHYAGKEGIITQIDDAGHLHGSWGGLAIIPEEDEWVVISNIEDEYSRLLAEIGTDKLLDLPEETKSALKRATNLVDKVIILERIRKEEVETAKEEAPMGGDEELTAEIKELMERGNRAAFNFLYALNGMPHEAVKATICTTIHNYAETSGQDLAEVAKELYDAMLNVSKEEI